LLKLLAQFGERSRSCRDAKDALLLDPVQSCAVRRVESRLAVAAQRLQKRTRGQWRRGKSVTLAKLREQLQQLGVDTSAFDAEVSRQFDAAQHQGAQEGQARLPAKNC